MHYLGSNSCHVIGFHISIIKYMCACSATRDSKQYLQQLMIPESVMGVYRTGGGCSTTSDKSSIFDVSQD